MLTSPVTSRGSYALEATPESTHPEVVQRQQLSFFLLSKLPSGAIGRTELYYNGSLVDNGKLWIKLRTNYRRIEYERMSLR